MPYAAKLLFQEVSEAWKRRCLDRPSHAHTSSQLLAMNVVPRLKFEVSAASDRITALVLALMGPGTLSFPTGRRVNRMLALIASSRRDNCTNPWPLSHAPSQLSGRSSAECARLTVGGVAGSLVTPFRSLTASEVHAAYQLIVSLVKELLLRRAVVCSPFCQLYSSMMSPRLQATWPIRVNKILQSVPVSFTELGLSRLTAGPLTALGLDVSDWQAPSVAVVRRLRHSSALRPGGQGPP